MHRKVTEFLTLYEPKTNLAVGGGSVGFMTDSDNSIENIRIYGNTSETGNPTPGASAWGDNYTMTLKIHKRNLMSGDEFANLLSFLSSEDNMIDYYDGLICYYIFDPYGEVVGKSDIAFKENTRYTITFRFQSDSYEYDVGLKFRYTDGTEELIRAPSNTEECTVNVTSAVGKTIEAIIPSVASYSYIYPDSFGIFEGEVSEEDFEPFQGQLINLSGKESLASGVINGVTYRDTIDLKSGTLTKYFENVTPRYNSSLFNYALYETPSIYGLKLARNADVANHCSSFTGFTYYASLAELRNNEYGYTFTADGKQVLFTFDKDFSDSPNSYFSSNKRHLQYKLVNPLVKSINPLALSEIPKGYVGVSLACQIPPHMLKVNYKK